MKVLVAFAVVAALCLGAVDSTPAVTCEVDCVFGSCSASVDEGVCNCYCGGLFNMFPRCSCESGQGGGRRGKDIPTDGF
jgi:hypothetical protein